MDCKLFGCVYAMKDGCAIDGHTSEEGRLNGTKSLCPHYDVECVNAKCACCCRNGSEDCIGDVKLKEITGGGN